MKFVNGDFEYFAACFAGLESEDGEIEQPQKLDRRQLDYSLVSLEIVDDYLTKLHEVRPNILGGNWISTVLWGGAYVGEVIRRVAPRSYNWVDYTDFVGEYPQLLELLGPERSIEVCAFLTPGGSAFCLPLNKVFKFLINGREDSVHFFAQCEVRER